MFYILKVRSHEREELVEITHLVKGKLKASGEKHGLIFLFVRHTTAGLTVNENADPSVRVDFESVFNRLSPENAPYLTHTAEGPDDMPAHIKAVLTGSSVTLPISGGRLNLGTWQGIYLCEFRNHGGRRKLVATVYS